MLLGLKTICIGDNALPTTAPLLAPTTAAATRSPSAATLGLALSAKHCGKRGADVRPDFNWDKQPVRVMGYR